MGEGPADDTALTPQGPDDVPMLAGRKTRAVVRRWDLELIPADVLKTLHAASDLQTRTLESEGKYVRTSHAGTGFIDATTQDIKLWRRPGDSWLMKLRGAREPVSYPDVLSLTVEARAHGSHVVARFEAHPLTRSSAIWFGAGILVVLLLLYLKGSATPPWLALLAASGVVIPVSRYVVQRRERAELLSMAHRALAQHELGPAQIEASPFRQGPGEG